MSAYENAVQSLINGGYPDRQAREILSFVCGEAQNEGYRRGAAAARAELAAAVAAHGPFPMPVGTGSVPMTPDREQIRAELTAEFVAWLVKRAREHRALGPQYAKQADVIGRLADKVRRGAVRPNNLLSLPSQGGPEDVPTLRARVAELEAQHAAVLALHRKHDDSEHCFADDETWPCLTRAALAPAAPRDLRPGAEAARRMLRSAVLAEAAELVAAYTGNSLDANAKMLRRAATAAADPSKATRMQDAVETLNNCKEPRHG